MPKLILEPVSNTSFCEIVRSYCEKGNTIGGTIEHYRKLIRDHNLQFNGIYLPQFNGFLSFDGKAIYMPAGGIQSTISLCDQEAPIASETKIFIFKLDGQVTYKNI